MASVMGRYQPCQERTAQSSSPTSRLANSKLSSTGWRVPATPASVARVVFAGPKATQYATSSGSLRLHRTSSHCAQGGADRRARRTRAQSQKRSPFVPGAGREALQPARPPGTNPSRVAAVLACRPGGVGSLLRKPRLFDDQHGIGAADVLDEIVAADVPRGVPVPQRMAEHPLGAPAPRITNLFGRWPAVLALCPAQQPFKISPRLPPWLRANEQSSRQSFKTSISSCQNNTLSASINMRFLETVRSKVHCGNGMKPVNCRTGLCCIQGDGVIGTVIFITCTRGNPARCTELFQ